MEPHIVKQLEQLIKDVLDLKANKPLKLIFSLGNTKTFSDENVYFTPIRFTDEFILKMSSGKVQFWDYSTNIGFLNKSLSFLFFNLLLSLSKNSTNSNIPPSNLKSPFFNFFCVKSLIKIFIPLFKNASSLILF